MSGLPKWRFFIVIFALLAAVLCILVRFAFYVADGNPGQAGRPQNFRERGQILDRNGKILASQIRLYDVYVSPPERDNIPELAAGLAPIVEMNEEDIRARISGARGSFILKRHVSPAVMEAIRDSRLRGVSTRQVPVRVYPEKSLAAQIIGFVGFDYTGLDGIERAFNDELSGEGNNGRGSTVVLTIDANVQYILEKVASSTLRETQAESVMFLAMDSRNGEILGSAVLPGFDPNNHTASDDRTYQNLTALPPYEPGSVFKIFSISALMDSGAISDNTVFTCNGFYEKTFPSGEKVRIECADGQAHGRVGPREIIINSCNVGAAYAADRQGNEAFYQSLLDYGFGKKTGAWVLMETAG
ncbi:MAG: penicillin-binding transpeptidase domain-containing protein, partial [Treponema sp.]|nr:penicillin-binding transpeptidase domain-containing protein [Treponema sp.]